MFRTQRQRRCATSHGGTLCLEVLEDRSAPSGLEFTGAESSPLAGPFATPWQSLAPAVNSPPVAEIVSTPEADVPGSAPVADGLYVPGSTLARFEVPASLDGTPAEAGLLLQAVSAAPVQNLEGGDEGPGVRSGAPEITNFRWTEFPDQVYVFEGDVTGEDVLAQPVTFGGLLTLYGPPPLVAYVVLDDFGAMSFSLEVTLGESEWGEATAYTQNTGGLISNLATVEVY